jgi:hypothetical protein
VLLLEHAAAEEKEEEEEGKRRHIIQAILEGNYSKEMIYVTDQLCVCVM